ncbi:MAG: DUF4071 domain-containing protein [Halanaerobiales bacterium]|nr:DUF4071 domain-containing protein [Halanaerobiales bacterium]
MVKVFISHSHEEKDLALAWQTLLDHISQGAIEVWLSSDTKPTGGMKIGGEWRDTIYNKLEKADYILAIISPRSIDRPWILWECGVASGTDKERGIIPIVFSMPLSDFDGPLSTYQSYAGEEETKIIEICERLLVEAGLSPKKQYWQPIIDSYLSSIRLHRPPRNASPTAVSLWVRRIENYINSGRVSELHTLADSMYASLGSEKAIDAQVHNLLSITFLEEKQYELALKEAKKALALLPDDLNLLHRKILVLLEMREHNQAKDNLDYIYGQFGEARYLPEIAGLEGRLYRELYELTGKEEELDNSINAYQIAYEKDPLNYYCGVNVVNLKLLKGEHDGAKEMANKVLDEASKFYLKGTKRLPSPKPRHKESALKGIQRVFRSANYPKDNLSKFEKILTQ